LADPPILLLPARLETLVTPRGADFDLLLRVFPDDIAIDAHDPDLTQDERDAGNSYWNVAAAGRQTAWIRLAQRFGDYRAAWIVRSLDPGNPLNPGSRTGNWTRPARTTVLPSMWTAFVYGTDGTLLTTAQGAPIPDALQIGPNPQPSGSPQFDTGLRWAVDFQNAVDVGMALRIPLTAAQKQLLDAVLVVGWKQLDPMASRDRLSALLGAHHYTGGLAFVPQGTPTTNTAMVTAAHSPRSTDHGASFSIELGDSLVPIAADAEARQLAAALALDASVFAHVAGADAVEQRDAKAMNTALWSATWGYFLEKMMIGGFAANTDVMTAVRRHFIGYVRAPGPLPAIRVGAQPYGILPAVSLARWASLEGNAVEAGLVNLLGHVRQVWLSSVAGMPQVSAASGDPDKDLVYILSQDAISTSIAARPMMGPGYFDYLFRFMRPTMTGWWGQQRSLSGTPIDILGLGPTGWLTGAPMVDRAVFADRVFVVGSPLVSPDNATDPSQPLSVDYISWLRRGAAGYAEIRDMGFYTGTRTSPPGDGVRTLLYKLLRHSALLEYQAAVYRIGHVAPTDRAETELVEVSPLAADFSPTIWDRLAAPPTTVPPLPWTPPPPPYTVGAQLDQQRLNGGGDNGFAEFWAGLDGLAGRPVEALDRAVCGTLDLASHRLDAWITSIATRRLAWLHDPANPARAQGLLLGGYGYVEKLSAALARLPSAGFVQAPSLNQAATAAVLRSGFLSHLDTPGDPFAVDLSSRRARLASGLLDGVRTQPLGALLGYRFERSLHDAQPPLDQYIDALRRLAPLGGRSDATPAADSPSAADVVDGLALARLRQQGGLAKKYESALSAQLDALDDAIDAVGDAILAESVFQMVRGNPVRAGATVDAVAVGESPPPELQSLQTPRTGVAYPQRLLVAFNDLAAAAGWTAAPPAAARQARAAAEPRLDAWAGALLGNPANVACRADYLDPVTGVGLFPPGRVQITLDQLGLSPLDVIAVASAPADAAETELQRRLAFALLRPPLRPAQVPATAGLRMVFDRDTTWSRSILGFPELLEAARAAGELLGSARGLKPADLTAPASPAAPSFDNDELKARADAAVAALQAVHDQLGSGDPEALRETLMRASHLGIYGAVPVSPVGTDQGAVDQLATQAAAVLKVVSSRLDAANALEKRFDRLHAPPPADQADHDTQRLRLVFGPGFVALPRFTPANAAELVSALGASDAVQRNDPMASVTWVHRQALVRPAVARLESALTFAEAIGASDGLALQVAQVPFAAGAVWSALPAGAGASAGSVGLVVHSPGPLDPTKPLGGLFLDEVLEVVPSASETTGIAFHHDEPNARAAQALLLAVPPTADPWTADTLAATVRETLDLAHIRMVDPDVLRQLAPALYFGVNLAQATVSSDFSTLDITRPDPPPLDRQLSLTVTPSPLVQARTAQVTVYAQDATWGGAIVDGTVKIPGLPEYRTNTQFPLTVGAAAAGGTVTAPGFATASIPWPPLVPATMTVAVRPVSPLLGTPVQLLVTAVDSQTGAAVQGATVNLANYVRNLAAAAHFPANAPYSVTLGGRTTRTHTGVELTQYPTATVQAPLYQDAEVPFFFDGL
jgi:hypothetical protein